MMKQTRKSDPRLADSEAQVRMVQQGIGGYGDGGVAQP